MTEHSKTIELLEEAIKDKQEFIKASNGMKNPGNLEMTHRAEGKMIAFLACLDALRGDDRMLRCEAGV